MAMAAPRPASRALAIALVLVLVLAAVSGALAQETGARSSESPEDYPDGPHREETFYVCTACHGFRIVAAQGMSRDRWDDTVTWMTERHKMQKLEGDERRKVLDYLAAAFPERQRAPGAWRNPFAPQ